MVKTCLTIASIAFGLGFGLSFAVSRNIKDSALVGLVSIPTSATVFFVVGRKGQKEALTFLEGETRMLQQEKDALGYSLQTMQENQNSAQIIYVQKQHELETSITELQAQLESDEQRHCSLQNDLVNLELTVTIARQQAQQAENNLEKLGDQERCLQTRLIEFDQEKEILRQAVRTLEIEKQSLTKFIDQLSRNVEILQSQEKNLQNSLADLTEQCRVLDNQLIIDRQEQERIQQELDNLVTRRQDLIAEIDKLNQRLQGLNAQRKELTLSLNQLKGQNNNLKKEQVQLSAKRDGIVQEIQECHQFHSTLNQELMELKNHERQLQGDIAILRQEQEMLLLEQDDLCERYQQLQSLIQSTETQQAIFTMIQLNLFPTTETIQLNLFDTTDIVSDQSVNDDLDSRVEQVEPTPALNRETSSIISEPTNIFTPLIRAEEFRMSNLDHTEWLWEEVLFTRWQYRPFLGSICLPREDTEEVWGTKTILDIVGRSLRHLGANNLDYDRVCERFGDEENLNWIKILTFAMSEYAYYMDSEDNFWQGLCKRLELHYEKDNAVPVTSLKQIAEKGIDLLKITKATENNKAYKIVSTLWLQSGIPQRNLHHFVELVDDLLNKSSWREIQNTDTASLAKRMLDTCQHHYLVLLRFLDYSCQPNTKPVSGELLQSIARVAIALQEHNQKPEILLDPAQRKEFLLGNGLQFSFFLRDWEALVQILNSDCPDRIRRSAGQGTLILELNPESFDIELILPRQNLSNSSWLRGNCSIPQLAWEGEIDWAGQVEILESTKTVKQVDDLQDWELLDARGNKLHSWNIEGIMPSSSYLIFDVWTGNRLIPPNELKGKTEIFCFYERKLEFSTSHGIEIISSFVPCSISGWQGKQLLLISEQAQITISSAYIEWDNYPTNYPQLRGIKLKTKKPTYLELPSIWYPPITLAKTISIYIENIESQNVLTELNQQVQLPNSTDWQEINLSSWISQSGIYLVRLVSESKEWREKFEIKSSFSLEEPKPVAFTQVHDRTNTLIQVPRQVPSKTEFWLEELTLRDLWTLEEVKFLLSNGQENYNFVKQADISGTLLLNLAALRGVLPESDRYSLSYQRSGEEIRSLLEISTGESISCTWAKNSIHLSGLHPGASYTISVWNLLRPSQIIKSISISEIETDHNLEELLSGIGSLGIFLIWLQTSGAFTQVLGWWSNILVRNECLLPDDVNDDYWFNVLDNEPLEEFVTLLSKINFKIEFRIEPEIIRQGISNLKMGRGYLPSWLDRNLLTQKIERIITSNNHPIVSPSSPRPPETKKLNYKFKFEKSRDNYDFRKKFIQCFEKHRRDKHLEQSIQLVIDKSLPDLIRVDLIDKRYLSELESILSDIGRILGTNIKLEMWG